MPEPSPQRRFPILGSLFFMIMGLLTLTLIINAVQCATSGPLISPPPGLQTAQRLEKLQRLVQQYLDENQGLPGETLSDALTTLAASGVDFDSPQLREIADGRDYWDAPFVYLRTDQKTLILRSIGGNGRHENGGGDDIQRVIELEP